MIATMSASMWFLPEHGNMTWSLSMGSLFQLTNMVGQGQVEEAGGLDLASVGPAGAITDQVHAELSLGGLDGGVGGASGDLTSEFVMR